MHLKLITSLVLWFGFLLTWITYYHRVFIYLRNWISC